MNTLIESLAGHLVIVNLGASGDADYPLPPVLQQATTLIEIDAGGEPISTSGRYFKQYRLRGVIAGSRDKRQFRTRKYWGASSLYEHRQDVIERYGLQRYTEIVETSEVEPLLIQDVLAEQRIDSIDFLKTDLEGADFEVIKSCEPFLPRLLAIQCELRFTPCYIGEPHFHDVAKYLDEHGFELMSLRPEYWKPHTPHRQRHQDGQIIWADCLFFKQPDWLIRSNPAAVALALAKHMILAGMLGHRSYAEWLLHTYRDNVPNEWITELGSYALPAPSIKRHRRWSLRNLAKRSRRRQSGSPDLDFAHVVHHA